jgi:hypothetical protein
MWMNHDASTKTTDSFSGWQLLSLGQLNVLCSSPTCLVVANDLYKLRATINFSRLYN